MICNFDCSQILFKIPTCFWSYISATTKCPFACHKLKKFFVMPCFSVNAFLKMSHYFVGKYWISRQYLRYPTNCNQKNLPNSRFKYHKIWSKWIRSMIFKCPILSQNVLLLTNTKTIILKYLKNDYHHFNWLTKNALSRTSYGFRHLYYLK